MVMQKRESARFPHIAFRNVLGQQEAYLQGTGLAVWEVAWVERVHGGDSGEAAKHLYIDLDLAEEALAYARSYPAEIEPELRVMEEASEERLREILPAIRTIDVDLEIDSAYTA